MVSWVLKTSPRDGRDLLLQLAREQLVANSLSIVMPNLEYQKFPFSIKAFVAELMATAVFVYIGTGTAVTFGSLSTSEYVSFVVRIVLYNYII